MTSPPPSNARAPSTDATRSTTGTESTSEQDTFISRWSSPNRLPFGVRIEVFLPHEVRRPRATRHADLQIDGVAASVGAPHGVIAADHGDDLRGRDAEARDLVVLEVDIRDDLTGRTNGRAARGERDES